MNEVGSASKAPAAKLLRTLTLWDLILYGVVIIQPTAPMSVFGVVSDRAHGHVVTSILIAMLAMLFTAISYGRMARAYPSAGSAFTYVGKEINPALGYITGWSMVMDYMLNPIICIVWISNQAHAFAHVLPYWGWVLFFFPAACLPECSRHSPLSKNQCRARCWHGHRNCAFLHCRRALHFRASTQWHGILYQAFF